MEWFDGSEGEIDIIAEAAMISATFEAFYNVHKVSAVQYYKLDADDKDHYDCSYACVS